MENDVSKPLERSEQEIDNELNEILSISTDVLMGMGKINELEMQNSNKKMHQRTLSPS